MQKIDRGDTREKLLTILFFTGIFLPVRLVFYTYVTDWWLGSFGVMSAALVVLFWLSNRGRLGRLGFVITRQVRRIARGKIGLFGIITSVFILYLYGNFIYGVESVPLPLVAQVHHTLQSQGITDMEQLARAAQDGPALQWYHFVWAFAMMLLPNDFAYAVFSEANALSDGWALHFATVFVIQELEFLALVVYFRYVRKP